MEENIVDIKYDEADDSLLVSRSSLISSLISTLREYFDGSKVYVEQVEDNYVVLRYDDETETFNISDDLELEMKAIVYALISDKSFMTPTLRFRLSEDDTESLVVVGIDLTENSVISVPEDDTVDYDYAIEISSRYLINRLQMTGIISFSQGAQNYNSRIIMTENPGTRGMNISEYEDIDNDRAMSTEWSEWMIDNFYSDDEDAVGEFEADDVTPKTEAAIRIPTKGSVAKKKKLKKLRKKRIKMNRMKDPSGYRKRSRAAKLRWRKHRAKYKKAFKKLYRSARGKKMAKMRGRAASLGRQV